MDTWKKKHVGKICSKGPHLDLNPSHCIEPCGIWLPAQSGELKQDPLPQHFSGERICLHKNEDY